jgi:hypothetical protein
MSQLWKMFRFCVDVRVSRACVFVQLQKKKANGLRRGKWTSEEEGYANRLIHEFKVRDDDDTNGGGGD